MFGCRGTTQCQREPAPGSPGASSSVRRENTACGRGEVKPPRSSEGMWHANYERSAPAKEAESMRIAQVRPSSRASRRGYGGTERVVSYLTEELVRQGHDVTLFASGDSRHSGESWSRLSPGPSA